MKLYEIVSSMRSVAEMEDVDEQTLKDTLDGLQMEFNVKAENICKVMVTLTASEAAVDAEIDRLQALKTQARNRREWIHKYLAESMQVAGIEEVKSSLFKIKFRNNPPSVVVKDESRIPEMWWKTKIERSLDKKGLLDEYRADKPLPDGVEVIQSKRLEVK